MHKLAAVVVALVLAAPSLSHATDPSISWGTPYAAPDSGYYVPVLLNDPEGLAYSINGLTGAYSVPFANLRLFDGLRTNLAPYDPNNPYTQCAPMLNGNYWTGQVAFCLQYDEFPVLRPDQYVVGAHGWFGQSCIAGSGPIGVSQYTLFAIKVHGTGHMAFIPENVTMWMNCDVELHPPFTVTSEIVTIPPGDPEPPGGDPEPPCCHEGAAMVGTEAPPKKATALPRMTWGRLKSIYR